MPETLINQNPFAFDEEPQKFDGKLKMARQGLTLLFLSYICSPACATNRTIRRINCSVSQRKSTIRQIERAYEISPFAVLPPDHLIRLSTDCTDHPGAELHQHRRILDRGGNSP